ncbi:hypothetical protein NZD89_08090 [Alicyclobacillus fastidiosus]|uniref:Uncharacterized protein n=1 Tax=Alicyclobacillus fastidiosus TaxID=392011 RepID=A0ABY6ZK73_9BACL|nr:hypothetical protein [Alicyclobacillus fastidiosus]WAH43339.1 hypothetical protein NZD89_08090 [Alicyclobacillus fastidiosus]GMA65398.1 hypothetical protein GCM10025859_58380 [Alicyclobacillus fastidiosus]
MICLRVWHLKGFVIESNGFPQLMDKWRIDKSGRPKTAVLTWGCDLQLKDGRTELPGSEIGYMRVLGKELFR